MNGINVGRWLAGGLAAGALMWVIEGAGSMIYMGEMTEALEAHNLSMTLNASVWFLTVLASLIAGLVLIFLYAAARPRFGPGPRTAIIVAVVMWFGGYLLSLLGYHMVGLYPSRLLVLWGIVGLMELILAALLGGAIYREAE